LGKGWNANCDGFNRGDVFPMTSSDTKQTSGGSLTSLLSAIQRGNIAVNNLTAAIKLIFPSSS
jgi:hypothetical protein